MSRAHCAQANELGDDDIVDASITEWFTGCATSIHSHVEHSLVDYYSEFRIRSQRPETRLRCSTILLTIIALLKKDVSFLILVLGSLVIKRKLLGNLFRRKLVRVQLDVARHGLGEEDVSLKKVQIAPRGDEANIP